MGRRFRCIFLVLTLASGLGGCFDYNQFIEVEDTGAATYTAELVFPELVVRMLEIDGRTFACADQFNPVPKDGVDFEIEDFWRVNNRICRYIAKGHLRDLNGLQFNRNDDTDTSTVFRVTELGAGRYRIVSDFRAMRNAAIEDDQAGVSKLMASTLLRDRFVRFQVKAPRVLNTNGEIIEDGTRARWERPLADLLVLDDQDPAAFVAEIEIDVPLLQQLSNAWSQMLDFFRPPPDARPVNGE